MDYDHTKARASNARSAAACPFRLLPRVFENNAASQSLRSACSGRVRKMQPYSQGFPEWPADDCGESGASWGKRGGVGFCVSATPFFALGRDEDRKMELM